MPAQCIVTPPLPPPCSLAARSLSGPCGAMAIGSQWMRSPWASADSQFVQIWPSRQLSWSRARGWHGSGPVAGRWQVAQRSHDCVPPSHPRTIPSPRPGPCTALHCRYLLSDAQLPMYIPKKFILFGSDELPGITSTVINFWKYLPAIHMYIIILYLYSVFNQMSRLTSLRLSATPSR